MADLTRAQAQSILNALGWRVNTSARLTQGIKDFQAGYNFGAVGLAVDGSLGPKTSAAMRYSYARLRAKRTTASANYSFRTVACRCGGRYASCRRIFQKRIAFQMMENYRKHAGGYSVVSACRCPSRNKAAGGSPTSRHVTGLACDVPATYSTTRVKSWRLATHIGYGRVSRRVKHIDMGAGRTRANPLIYVDGR